MLHGTLKSEITASKIPCNNNTEPEYESDCTLNTNTTGVVNEHDGYVSCTFPETSIATPGVTIREVHMGTKREGWNLVIPAKILGRECNAIIDTAAQVTVINRDFFQTLENRPSVVETVNLKGASDSNLMLANYVKEVPLQIGTSKYKWNVFVADISDQMILGLDFLKESQAVVDLRKCEMVIGGKSIAARYLNGDGEQEGIGQVFVKRKTVIPPNSIRMLQARTEGNIGGTCCFTPTFDHQDVFSPHTLNQVDEKSSITVCLRNHSNRFVTFKRGFCLGLCTSASILDDDIETYEVRNIKKSTYSSENSVKKVPDHLTDLYQKSCTHISNDEAQMFANLLIEYQDVFAKHSTDLGCFTQIQHTIDTGDAQPIKHRMRRTPIGFEGEEEKHLKEMLECGVIQPSTSDWAAPPVLVRKKDGSIRWCIDYRSINNCTQKSVWPVPSFSQCADLFSGLHYMSTVDMASGYWQIEVAEQDRPKTAWTV